MRSNFQFFVFSIRSENREYLIAQMTIFSSFEVIIRPLLFLLEVKAQISSKKHIAKKVLHSIK
jgi:hypothetical protein